MTKIGTTLATIRTLPVRFTGLVRRGYAWANKTPTHMVVALAAVAVFVIAAAALLAWPLLGSMWSRLGLFNEGYRYVAINQECGNIGPCYGSIQKAVDAAKPGDTIKIAQGVYTAKEQELQVVRVSKSITLTGGYTTTNWLDAMITQTVTIDAQGFQGRRGIYIEGTNAATITVSSLTIANGNAEGSAGGGIFVGNGTVVLLGNTLTGNRATGEKGGGGALYVANGTVYAEGNLFQGNSGRKSEFESGYGGAIHVADGKVLLSYNTFVDNEAYALYPGSRGGALYVAKGEVVANRNTFSSSTGDGIYIAGGTIELNDNEISGHKHGSGVVIADGHVTMNRNLIQDNASTGGVRIGISPGNPTAVLVGNTFRGNKNDDAGGALSIASGNVTLVGNGFRENSSAKGGGAIFVEGWAAVDILGSRLQANTSQDAGGALLLRAGRLTLQDCAFAENRSQKGDGGALFVTDGQVSIAGSSFEYNYAGRDGGGLYVNHGSLTLDRSSVVSNTAALSNSVGGGLAIISGTVTGANDLIVGNVSPGAGVYVADGNLRGTNWTVASNGRRGVWAAGVGTAVLTNTLVAYHNTSGLSGKRLTADTLLSFNNGEVCAENATCTGVVEGDPAFANLQEKDYRLGPGSAAIDAGKVVALKDDFNGKSRPLRDGFDIGAYERPAVPDTVFSMPGRDWLGLTTPFTNSTETTGSTQYTWFFGDYGQSAEEVPTHTYQAPGNYRVVLLASNEAGSWVDSHDLVVFGPPVTEFSVDTPKWLGQAIALTNKTASVPPGDDTITFQWDLGDGTTSKLANPATTFDKAGLYTVTLRATNAAGTISNSHQAILYGSPAVTLTVTDPNWLGEPVSLWAGAATEPPGDPTVVLAWDFGDAVTEQGKPETKHSYATPGIYSVKVTASNAAGKSESEETIAVYGPPTIESVAAGPSWTGQEATFEAYASTDPAGDPTVAITWDFGDGSKGFGSGSVTHEYAQAGTYSVIATASNMAGTDTSTQSMVVYGPPTVTLTPVTRAWIGVSTAFAAAGTTTPEGDTSVEYEWDFGDGVIEEAPASTTHVYGAVGVYPVSVTAENPAGSSTVSQTLSVYGPTVVKSMTYTAGAPTAASVFTAEVETSPPGDTEYGLTWDFGDGTVVSGTLNVSHVYLSAGVYEAKVTATNPAGSNSAAQTVKVYTRPTADFYASPLQGQAPLTVQFRNTTTTTPEGDPALTYIWSFGDGTTSSEIHPTHIYTATGTYTVTLTAYNGTGSDAKVAPSLVNALATGYRIYLPLVLGNVQE